MHDTLDGAERSHRRLDRRVPAALARSSRDVGHELPGDRIKRIARVDQVGHRRRNGDGVTGGDIRKLL